MSGGDGSTSCFTLTTSEALQLLFWVSRKSAKWSDASSRSCWTSRIVVVAITSPVWTGFQLPWGPIFRPRKRWIELRRKLMAFSYSSILK
ncbi:unnamed protein product [Gadus morhua 'NCC']